MKEKVIHLKKAVKKFGGRTVVNVNDIELGRYGIEGLIGPNGAGKSSLIKLITQKYTLTEGEIIYYSANGPVDISKKTYDGLARLNLVASNQIIMDFDSLSIKDSMLLSLASPKHERFYKLFNDKKLRAEAKAEMDRYFEYFQFECPEGFALSAGEKKLLDIIRCLMLKPRFLLLDEPTAGLPQDQTDKVIELMRKLADEQGVSILIVEHDLDLIWQVCEHIHFMADGEILIQGTPEQIKCNEIVNNKYIGEDSDA